MKVTITSDKVAAVDQEYFWQPMSTCPTGVKVQLLGAHGVAVYGAYNGKEKYWIGWAPLPKMTKEIKECLG